MSVSLCRPFTTSEETVNISIPKLPYGTLSDEDCRSIPIPLLQPTYGLLAIWVTGRAMELGRELISLWGYRRIDEIVWIKVNQLGGLVRTGRTGHWLK